MISRHHLPAMPTQLRLIVCLLCACATFANAQLSVTLSGQKKELVAYEPVRATVQITNRSALPILLATSSENEASWIRFSATTERGDALPVTGKIKDTPPIQLRPGQSIEHGIDLGTVFPMANFGSYSLQAHVWCPPDNSYAPSNTIRVNVVGAREIWSAAFGVPVGQEGGGTSRIFRILQYRSIDNIQLYVRLDDRTTGMVLTCYSLGTMLDMREPSYALDPDGRLHVLQLCTPTAYYHTVVDSSGRIALREAYLETKGNRPILTAAADGSIGVLGGERYDPEKEAAARSAIRKSSDRPAGLEKVLPSTPPGPKPPANGDFKPKAIDKNYQPLPTLPKQ